MRASQQFRRTKSTSVCTGRGGPPTPLTPEGPARYADLQVTPDGRRLLAVRERPGDGEAVNEIVAIPTEGPGDVSGERVLGSGPDFVACPRVSPDGALLAWTQWDHPAMPWDETELWLAGLDPDVGLDEPTRLAGGQGESLFQPGWDGAGRLTYVSDRTGWWNLYRFGRPGRPAARPPRRGKPAYKRPEDGRGGEASK